MIYETLSALFLFAFVSSVTPGPNNLMLLSSGTHHGFKRTLPHILGIELGFAILIMMVGVGLMNLFELYPASHQVLKIAGASYLVYLAYKIGTSVTPIDQPGEKSKPFTFLQAALFQWVNPKAWTMALTAISLYAQSRQLTHVMYVALAFMIVGLPSASLWTTMGIQL